MTATSTPRFRRAGAPAGSAAGSADGSAADSAALEARRVTLSYEKSVIFDGLDLRIERGRVTTLVGANGSGKSTVLKAFGRLLTPGAGTVELDGHPVRSLSTREVARRLAILPQKPLTPSATTVRDLVSRGRHPHQSLLRPFTPHDSAVVDAALAATGLRGLEGRDAGSLSGGQLQRAWIALILAQEAPTILLDEPTTFLDLSHQLDVLRLVRRINREHGATVVMVLHDLSLAGRYSDRLVVLGGGRVIADGTPWEVLTPAILREAFDLEALVIPDPSCGSPLVVPVDTEHR
ncbi:ABC transporter ATP-binding protein [Subtercola boreus]|uniref:Cobalamin/Fe3+-siderophore ABC transporter ATP-binding protein n=1 Tax=Subtercola boreus TaxID=120213 RepID=A0A3E0W895_9MICO|nr:ABC transporter ATP-binding protein [Subtercola boreus]RFA18048.1 cobalamin/Fe3+-siderophore ABC transporter ATP-binding protein [Subtercola boreus]RFA18430.1 cobalamin/Fe3+-siderophore ABC transporter ATP-binding protein [Subtercola boreus]RFA24959.1 cobalamin/Fe3+-siderophore ABC transporter ATP-binding protein [Subtercola boreus]